MSNTTTVAEQTAAEASQNTAGKAPKRRSGNSTSKKAFTIPPHIREALQAARGPKEALAQFQDNSPGTILFTLLEALVASVNQQIPSVFTTQNVNLFGDPNNHLDPLNFNGTVSASASGSFCLPQACHSFLGVEICIPPWVPCASGEADASLDNLTGLSGLQITSFSIPNVTVNGSTASATGTLQLGIPQLTANGGAEASGGPDGFSIPISGYASVTVSSVASSVAITVSCDLDQPKLTACTIDTLTLNYAGVNPDIGGLGPFDSLLSGLVFPLISSLAAAMGMGSPNQELASALQGQLQGMINSQL